MAIVDDINELCNIASDGDTETLPPGFWLFEVTCMPLLIVCGYLFWEDTAFVTFCMASLLIGVCFAYKRRELLTIVVVSILLAQVLEFIGIASGTWWWNAPDILGMPLWVPFAYAFFNVLFYNLSLRIEKM